MSLEGKVCIVTGGLSGIGKAIATRFLNQGASVVIADKQNSKTTKKDTKKNDLLLVIESDITLVNEPQRIVKETIKKFGKLDILVNNAGVGNNPNLKDSEEIENFDFIFNLNVRSVINMTNACIRYLKKSGGNIINLSSIASFRAASFTPYYSMSKAAISMYTKSLACKLTPDSVRVNEICPGFTKTSFYSGFFSNKDKLISNEEGINVLNGKMAPRIPMQRLAEPEEVANAALFLASSEAAYISGIQIVVDGGALCIDAWGDTFPK
uniref:Short-chain dehydrogenase n=1 Tax=Rhabditophanes sp. KR3021 TaxID=114890 RepID=A0AC35TKI1_9BILA